MRGNIANLSCQLLVATTSTRVRRQMEQNSIYPSRQMTSTRTLKTTTEHKHTNQRQLRQEPKRWTEHTNHQWWWKTHYQRRPPTTTHEHRRCPRNQKKKERRMEKSNPTQEPPKTSPCKKITQVKEKGNTRNPHKNQEEKWVLSSSFIGRKRGGGCNTSNVLRGSVTKSTIHHLDGLRSFIDRKGGRADVLRGSVTEPQHTTSAGWDKGFSTGRESAHDSRSESWDSKSSWRMEKTPMTEGVSRGLLVLSWNNCFTI